MESDAFSESSFSNGESCESDENGEIFETCSFNDSVLQLPEFFCDEEDVFREVITSTTWKSLINRKNAERLKQLLPTFPENDDFEKQETLRKLFNGDNFRFGSPFKLFFQKLRDGFLSSEVVEITNALKEANYREYRSQQKQYSYKLLHDVLLSRQKLVEASYALPPENSVKMQQYFTKPKDATLSEKTRLRYFSMLQDLREEIGEVDTSSDDENYPESCPAKVPKKYKKHFNHEVSTGASICMPTTSDTSNYSGNGNFFHTNGDAMEVSEDRYREMLQNHKEKAVLEPKRPELSTTFIDIKSVSSRCNFPKRASVKSTDGAGKKKAKTSDASDKSGTIGIPESIESSVPLINIVIKEEHNTNSSSSDPNIDSNPPAVQETEVQTDPLTLLDEGDDSEICENPTAKLYSPRPEVTQYPTCFFALLRDIFCESSEQKLSAVKLEEKVKNWQGGPTASLFEWMSFQESWSDLVSSALKFLAGDLISILPETFIPFLDYKEKQQQWQWIGSGRDSDEQMFGLCQQWLDGKDDISLDMLETSQGSPPPPRVTTGWTVRPTAENEKQAYRQQECVRYQNPHKAFTFKVHGYEAVVGPVKGVYGKESGVNKAREHSLLTSDRPPFVTILSLVRDSAARLPNGEGTRADICELLKDSQYLAAASDQQIHTVVSGALDRLHYEKDPCVKYDVNRKLWIYLHRHRTEEEFERIHQAQAAAAKARKAVQKNKLPKIKHSRPLPVSLGPETTALNIDIPTLISSGSQSPKTQGSPKPNRYVMHTSSQVDIKMAVESNVKKEEDSSISNPPETELIAAPVTLSSCVQDISNSRPSTSTYSFATAKNAIGNITATQIVSVTPIQIKSTDQIKPNISTQVHDVLNVDMKPSSPSFVGQPPVLQPVISHQISDKTNPVIPTSTTPTLITTPIITKAKANCLQANALAGFQTIVIKQEPGLRPCGTIPLLSIEENMPSSNSSGPVVARLVHGSQYLSFSNILASSNACSSNKPLAGTVQNFRVHGGNICQQVLSTSTIKVMHSAPVSAIADTRFPVIQLKNQVNAKEAAPTSLNVCGRIYQMTNIRNAVISKPNDTKIPANKDNSEIEDLKESISATVPSAPLSVPNRKTQPVIKVSPK